MGPLASPSAAEPAPTEGPAWLGGAAVSSGDIGTGSMSRLAGCCNCLLQLRRRQTGTEVKTNFSSTRLICSFCAAWVGRLP